MKTFCDRKLAILLSSVLIVSCTLGTGFGLTFSWRKLRFDQDLDPGNGERAVSPHSNTIAAIRSKYDHDMVLQAAAHKGSGGRGSRGRGGDPHSPCALTRGSWCRDYFRQERVPWKPGPRGSMDCPKTEWGACNGVGNCHYDIGICQCPAGWKGAACDERDLRPCTNAHKDKTQPVDLILSFINPDGMDRDLTASGWTASRCGGFCDADRASCWCPAHTLYGRKPPPEGSPPWVRYSQRGRPIMESCKPGMVRDAKGNKKKNDWGNSQLDIDDLWGEQGWCNVNDTERIPKSALGACGGWRGCQEEGIHGGLCESVNEETCLNQCSGHGECDSGYCRCHPGWYGHDCARKKAGEELEPGLEEVRPWLQPIVMPVPAAAQEPPAAPGPGQGEGQQPPGGGARMRPLIYIYDMPPEFTSRMHQYKLVTEHCGYRQFMTHNRTELFADGYSVEVYLHEMLAISPHRTFDPEEADFFYVPVYYTCWMWPVNGWADTPFYGPPTSWHRYANAAHLWLAALRWIQSNFPFWERRGGRDHIWMTNHDEGACYMPTEIYHTSIMLTHWGRLAPDHTSNTAYGPDNYSEGIKWPGVLGGSDTKTLYEGHPCYDPQKDLVIPGFKPPEHFIQSPLLGNWPFKRDILLYLRGDVGKHRLPNYSRGIRQKLYSLASENRWADKYGIYVGEKYELQGNYGQHLARSIFCPVVPGDGYSMRFEDAVLHGCLPLIIMDGTHAVFESIMDIDAFSLRIAERAVNEHLPQVLMAVSPDQIERMQRRLAQVWHRFAYGHGPLIHSAMRLAVQLNQKLREDIEATMPEGQKELPPDHPLQPVLSFPVHNDAFATILQWLHSRIPYTRNKDGGADAAEDIPEGELRRR